MPDLLDGMGGGEGREQKQVQVHNDFFNRFDDDFDDADIKWSASDD